MQLNPCRFLTPSYAYLRTQTHQIRGGSRDWTHDLSVTRQWRRPLHSSPKQGEGTFAEVKNRHVPRLFPGQMTPPRTKASSKILWRKSVTTFFASSKDSSSFVALKIRLKLKKSIGLRQLPEAPVLVPGNTCFSYGWLFVEEHGYLSSGTSTWCPFRMV